QSVDASAGSCVGWSLLSGVSRHRLSVEKGRGVGVRTSLLVWRIRSTACVIDESAGRVSAAASVTPSGTFGDSEAGCRYPTPREFIAYMPEGIAEPWTAMRSHFPSALVNVSVRREKRVRSGPSLGLTALATCAQTTPVVPMTRHWGLMGVTV